MKILLLKWAVMALAVAISAIIASQLNLGLKLLVSTPGDVISLFIGVAILSLVNATLGKVLKFITAPLNCLTLGIFSLIINAILFAAVGSMKFGFEVTNFVGAFVGSIFVSIANGILGGILIKDKDEDND